MTKPPTSRPGACMTSVPVAMANRLSGCHGPRPGRHTRSLQTSTGACTKRSPIMVRVIPRSKRSRSRKASSAGLRRRRGDWAEWNRSSNRLRRMARSPHGRGVSGWFPRAMPGLRPTRRGSGSRATDFHVSARAVTPWRVRDIAPLGRDIHFATAPPLSCNHFKRVAIKAIGAASGRQRKKKPRIPTCLFCEPGHTRSRPGRSPTAWDDWPGR